MGAIHLRREERRDVSMLFRERVDSMEENAPTGWTKLRPRLSANGRFWLEAVVQAAPGLKSL